MLPVEMTARVGRRPTTRNAESRAIDSQAMRNEKAVQAPSTRTMLARKSGKAAASGRLRGGSSMIESEAAAAEAPNAIRKTPLRPSYRKAIGLNPRTLPPLPESAAPPASKYTPIARAQREPAVDSTGEIRFRFGPKAATAASKNRAAAATHSPGRKPAPRAVLGVTITSGYTSEGRAGYRREATPGP